MNGFSKTILHRCYDFIETYILRDYHYAIQNLGPILTLSENMVILDLGGGTGRILEYFSSKVQPPLLIDKSKEMLTHSLSETVLKIQADASFIPLKTNTVDVILLIHMMHHIEKKHHFDVMKEVYRVLKSTGRCYLMDLYYPKTPLNTIFTKVEEFCVGKTYHISSKSICSTLKTVGFDRISRTYTDPKHCRYIVSAAKT